MHRSRHRNGVRLAKDLWACRVRRSRSYPAKQGSASRSRPASCHGAARARDAKAARVRSARRPLRSHRADQLARQLASDRQVLRVALDVQRRVVAVEERVVKREGLGHVLRSIDCTPQAEHSWSGIRAAQSCAGVRTLKGDPSSSIDPSSGLTAPAMILMSVDFPDPDGPIIVTNSPARTTRLTPFSTRVVPAAEAVFRVRLRIRRRHSEDW